MILNDIAKQIERFAIDNSPGILTAVGVTGAVTVAYLSGTASFKAAALIRNEENHREFHDHKPPLTPKEKFQLVWVEYIPVVAVGAVTITAIIGANRIGSRRAAAVAAAYSISEKAFSEYKEKVIERIGANKEQSVRDELAQDRVDRNPNRNKEVIIVGSGEVLCYESFTGRYFKSNVDAIKKAENEINKKIINENYASLSDFYNLIGLATTDYADEVGWNTDKFLSVEFSTTMSDDDQPCICIGFEALPIYKYYRFN
mgnify:FL=1